MKVYLRFTGKIYIKDLCTIPNITIKNNNEIFDNGIVIGYVTAKNNEIQNMYTTLGTDKKLYEVAETLHNKFNVNVEECIGLIQHPDGSIWKRIFV